MHRTDVGSERACTAAGAAALQKQRDAQFLHGLRRDLEALKEPVINQRATPYPWGRCHMFRDDDDFDLSSGLDEAHHCSILSLEQLEVLRRETNELLRPTLPPGAQCGVAWPHTAPCSRKLLTHVVRITSGYLVHTCSIQVLHLLLNQQGGTLVRHPFHDYLTSL